VGGDDVKSALAVLLLFAVAWGAPDLTIPPHTVGLLILAVTAFLAGATFGWALGRERQRVAHAAAFYRRAPR
jgi:hypothetical protein